MHATAIQSWIMGFKFFDAKMHYVNYMLTEKVNFFFFLNNDINVT